MTARVPGLAMAVLAVQFGSMLTVRPALAQDAQSTVERARALMRQFEYREAATVLQDFITRESSIDDELKARELLVVVWGSAGEDGSARRAATELYERDPGHELADPERLSPRIRAYFSEAARLARAAPPAEVDVHVRRVDDHLLFRLSARTPARVASAELMVREPGDEEWERVVDMERQGAVWRGSVPAEEALQYYVRFHAPSGYIVAEGGTSDAPLEWREVLGGGGAGVGAVPEDKSPLPWVVGLVAAVAVAGAAVGVGVAQPWNDGPNVAGEIQLP